MRIRNRISAIVATVSVIAFSLFGLTTVAVAANTLSFNNTVKIGQNATVGFSTRYGNVSAGVDALVTVTSVSTGSTLSNIDRVSTVNNEQLWSNVQVGAGGGAVTYRVEFVATGSRTPIVMTNFDVNVGDIDAKQFVQFAGPSSYTLAANTQLAIQQHPISGIPLGSYRFTETNGTGSTDTDTRFWAQVHYDNVSYVDVTLGAGVGGSALFQVSFGAASWGSTAVTPVTPTPPTYTVSYDCNPGLLTCGGGITASTSGTGGTAQAIQTNGFTPPTNYSFVAWNTQPDGSGVSYADPDTIIPTTDVRLYAIWKDSTTTVTYHGNGHTGGSSPTQASVPAGSQYTVEGNTGGLVANGFQFIGWNTLANGAGAFFAPGTLTNIVANTDLYAVWQPVPVVPPDAPLNIDLDPGEPIGGGEVDYVIPGQPDAPNCDPTTNPNSAWTLSVIPVDPAGAPVEIDAGCTPEDGDIFGIAVLPQDVPEGIYEVVYESTTGEKIIRYFEVGPGGIFEGQSNTDPRLAKTGTNDAFVAQFGAVLAMATGSALLLMRRKRSAA